MNCRDHLHRLVWLKISILAITLGLFIACEVDMTVALDGKNPPTFSLSGSGNLMFFLVSEVSPANQNRIPFDRDSQEDKILWHIRPDNLSSKETRIWRLQPITYGKIPAGFMQKIPEQGEPPALIEGKVYQVGGPASNANGGHIWFAIRNGEAVEISEPGAH